MRRFTVWVVLGVGVGVLACEGSVTLPERPRFEVVWPRPERYPDSTLVAEGHVLTVAGRVALPYYKPWGVWVYVEGRRVGEASFEAPGLVPRWDPDQFITFRVLVRDFGSVGTKDLVVRVCQGGVWGGPHPYSERPGPAGTEGPGVCPAVLVARLRWAGLRDGSAGRQRHLGREYASGPAGPGGAPGGRAVVGVVVWGDPTVCPGRDGPAADTN